MRDDPHVTIHLRMDNKKGPTIGPQTMSIVAMMQSMQNENNLIQTEVGNFNAIVVSTSFVFVSVVYANTVTD